MNETHKLADTVEEFIELINEIRDFMKGNLEADDCEYLVAREIAQKVDVLMEESQAQGEQDERCKIEDRLTGWVKSLLRGD